MLAVGVRDLQPCRLSRKSIFDKDKDAFHFRSRLREYHFAADAYYPIFAQFGYVGIALFVWFFVYLFKQMNKLYDLTSDIKRYKTALIIIAYILIQATSNALANERSVIAMGILVLALYKYKPRPRYTAINSFGLDFARGENNTKNNMTNEDSANK